MDSGWLSKDSLHEIWLASHAEGRVGGAGQEQAPDTSWHQVLRDERMPFVDWLIHRVPCDGPLGKVSGEVLSAKCDGGIAGNDLAAVLAFVAGDPTLAGYSDQVRAEHQNWERETLK